MKKSLLLSCAILAAGVVGSSSAMALDVDKPHAVFTRFAGFDVYLGKLYCDEGQFVDTEYDYDYDDGYDYDDYHVEPTGYDNGGGGYDDYDDYNYYFACRYQCMWVNAAQLPLNARIFLDEIITPDEPDCERNSKRGVNTTIVLAPKLKSKGFDRNQQKRTVVALALGEFRGHDGRNDTSGVIAYANSGIFTYYPLETEKKDDYHVEPADPQPAEPVDPQP